MPGVTDRHHFRGQVPGFFDQSPILSQDRLTDTSPTLRRLATSPLAPPPPCHLSLSSCFIQSLSYNGAPPSPSYSPGPLLERFPPSLLPELIPVKASKKEHRVHSLP